MLPKKLFTPKCLHPDRDVVFREDIEQFYSYLFSQMEKLIPYEEGDVNYEGKLLDVLSYALFKQFWKERRMSMLHFAKTKEENAKEFYEVLFGEVQSLFYAKSLKGIQCPHQFNFLLKIFSVFTLYSIYYTQIHETFYQINTIPEVLSDLNSLMTTLTELNLKRILSNDTLTKELALIVNKLYEDDAFSIGVINGLKTIILNKYGLPLEQRMNVYKDYLDITNSFNDEDSNTIHNDTQILKNDEKEYNNTKREVIGMIKNITQNSDFNTELFCDFFNKKNSLQSDTPGSDGRSQDMNIQKEDLISKKISNFDLLFFQVENDIHAFNKK